MLCWRPREVRRIDPLFRERRRGNGYMSELIAGLGEKWRRESRPSKAQEPRVHNQVFDLLPDLSIYEWRMLMYLLGAKEVVKRGPFEIFGTVLPGWSPEMVLTYQVM